jgi:hypothetical protein
LTAVSVTKQTLPAIPDPDHLGHAQSVAIRGARGL